MTLASIFKTVLAIADAVPQIMKWIDRFYEMYLDHKIQKVEQNINLKKQKKKALMRAIRDAKDDKERVSLSIVLHDINNS